MTQYAFDELEDECTPINAEVIGVYPDKVKIIVDDLESFCNADEKLRVGSYLQVADSNDSKLIAVIESYSIEVSESTPRRYLIEASPLGVLEGGIFKRGGDSIAIPPKKVEPAKADDIICVYTSTLTEKEKFSFSSLARNTSISVPVDGDKFFNKHIGIVGSTGSGKSHTVASILQRAIKEKKGSFTGLNNSHVVIFDIHGEYSSAFPNATKLNVDEMVIPYWLLNGEELEELFLESGDHNNYNQASILQTIITLNKKKYSKDDTQRIYYESPVFFKIDEILNCLVNLKNETRNAINSDRYMIEEEDNFDGDKIKDTDGVQLTIEDRYKKYFEKQFQFRTLKSRHINKGTYGDGSLDKFISRFRAKYSQERLKFMFGDKAQNISLEKTLAQFIGYSKNNESNVTIIDLSGIPFEVLSITVSLISRLLFDFGYSYKRYKEKQRNTHDIPLLLVFEEAHKYVPKSDLARFRSSRNSIERIAKEGRKYGVTLMLASQRPSEISETIFSQCSNFIAMRLTNPDDQNYVRKVLPDTFGNLTSSLSSLQTGDALLMGDAVPLPSLVTIGEPSPPPSSSDIPYLKLWKEEWKSINFKELTSGNSNS